MGYAVMHRPAAPHSRPVLRCVGMFVPEFVQALKSCKAKLKAKKVSVSVVLAGCRKIGECGKGLIDVESWNGRATAEPGCDCEQRVKDAFLALFK